MTRDPEVAAIFDALRRDLALSCPTITPWDWEHAGLAPTDPRRLVARRLRPITATNFQHVFQALVADALRTRCDAEALAAFGDKGGLSPMALRAIYGRPILDGADHARRSLDWTN